MTERLVGYDISGQMLRKARAKGIYDELLKADLQHFHYEGGPADLVTAADVFMYVGALEAVVGKVAGLLCEGGLFAFSVERLVEREGVALQPSRRYAHSQSYVRDLLADARLHVLSLESQTLRQDRREPVEGLIVVAERHASSR